MSRVGRAFALTLLVAGCATDLPRPSPSGSSGPASVSPDASLPELPAASIAFMRIEGSEYPGAVVLQSLPDLSERVVTDAGYPIAFTSDGAGLFVAEPVAEPRNRLVLYPTGGGEADPLLEAVFLVSAPPVASPDGRYVALSSDGAVPNGIVVLDLDAGTATQLTTDGASGTPRWSPDSRSIAYQAAAPGTGWVDLYVVEVGGGRPRRMTDDRVTDVPLAWTDEGIVISREGTSDNVFPARDFALLDDASGELRETAERPTVPSSVRPPDGSWELVRGTDGVELRPVDGSASGQPLPDSDRAQFTWSPDGAWLVWSALIGGPAVRPDLVVLRVPDGPLVGLTRTNDAEEVMPVWGTPSFSVPAPDE